MNKSPGCGVSTAVGNRLIAPLATIPRRSFRNEGYKAGPRLL